MIDFIAYSICFVALGYGVYCEYYFFTNSDKDDYGSGIIGYGFWCLMWIYILFNLLNR